MNAAMLNVCSECPERCAEADIRVEHVLVRDSEGMATSVVVTVECSHFDVCGKVER